MLDVTKEEPEQVAEDSVSCDPISGSSDRHHLHRHEPTIMKPYLKFGERNLGTGHSAADSVTDRQ
jgi:hypothetical protein